MTLQQSSLFIADAELQYNWYGEQAGWSLAERYLTALASTCALIERHPFLGPAAALSHPRLSGWRFFVVMRPFQKHVVFYEVVGGEVILRRVLHGRRNLRKRLLEPPGAE